jgi:hypothetical protein
MTTQQAIDLASSLKTGPLLPQYREALEKLIDLARRTVECAPAPKEKVAGYKSEDWRQ